MKKFKFEDLVNKKFNFLTLISLADSKKRIRKDRLNNSNILMWNCKCDCGNYKIIPQGDIISNNIKSCGCKRIEKIKEKNLEYHKLKRPEFVIESTLYSRYKTEAKISKREFTITKEEFIKLVNDKCHYCNRIPHLIRKNKTGSVKKALNGVDRINSSLGYTINNVLSCCPDCNRAKMARTFDDFKIWVKLVYDNLYQN